MKQSLFICFCFLGLFSCKKDEPVDLSSLCSKGDLWMSNSTDTFSPDHLLDQFWFNQGGGYHVFYWEKNPMNYFTFKVNFLPDSGKTFVYKKTNIVEFQATIKGKEYKYLSPKDSIFQLAHKGTYLELNAKELGLVSSGSPDYYFKACDLKMTDIVP